METKVYEIIDSVEKLEQAIVRTRAAQSIFSTYTQEQVDKIFRAAALAANKARIPLAKLAVEETGMGVVEDKVIKNNYAAEYIYNAYKDTKTCGVVEEDKAFGIKKIAEPIGVVAAVIPTTNPTSTAIFKCLIALKTRNAIIISPHPRAKNATIAAAKPTVISATTPLPKAPKPRIMASSFFHSPRAISAPMNTIGIKFRRIIPTGNPATNPPTNTPTGMVTMPQRMPLAMAGRSSSESIPMATGMVNTMVAPSMEPVITPPSMAAS